LVKHAPSLPSRFSGPSPGPSSSHVLIAIFRGGVWLLLQCFVPFLKSVGFLKRASFETSRTSRIRTPRLSSSGRTGKSRSCSRACAMLWTLSRSLLAGSAFRHRLPFRSSGTEHSPSLLSTSNFAATSSKKRNWLSECSAVTHLTNQI